MAVVGMVVVVELGVAGWRQVAAMPSGAPVFWWPEGRAMMADGGRLGGALANYRCDRGAELRLPGPEGTQLTVLYLEWDRIASGPAMGFAAHPAEECNTGLGYRFLGVDSEREYEAEGGVRLRFDCTRFTDVFGKPVYMFKMAWIQGAGAWQVRDEGKNRWERLRRAFVRHTGEGRIVQGGVFGARDAEHAWEVFASRVLDRFEWR